MHIRDVGKGLAKVGGAIGKGVGAVGRGIFQIGKGVVKGGGKVIGGVAGGVVDGGREVVGGVRKAFGRDKVGEAAPEGLYQPAPAEDASLAKKVQELNESASAAGKPCTACEAKAPAAAGAATTTTTTTNQQSLPPAQIVLACEDERIEDYLLGMQAFLSPYSEASTEDKQAIASAAAQLMNATQHRVGSGVPSRLGAKASDLLNTSNSWSPGGLVDQSLAAVFGEGAGPQMLQQGDLPALAQACGTPRRFRSGPPFEQLKIDVAALARQVKVEDPGLLSRTLLYCPRLAFELALRSKAFENEPKFCEAAIAQYLGVTPATSEAAPQAVAESASKPPASETAPASGGTETPAPSTDAPAATPVAEAPAAAPSAPPATAEAPVRPRRPRPVDQAQEALTLAKDVDPNSSEHQPTVDRLQKAKDRLLGVAEDRGNPNRRKKLVQAIDQELTRLGVTATPAAKPSPNLDPMKPSSAAPSIKVAEKPQGQESLERQQLLDRVFEQDQITSGDRANTENAGRAEELEKKKALRDLAIKPREELKSSDAAGLTEASRQIASEIARSEKQLVSINDQITKEKDDRAQDKLRQDYARVQANVSTLKSVSKELAEKKTYADRLGKAEGLLKDFEAHRHFDAWGAGSFNLLDTTDDKARKDALVKIQSDMQDRTLPDADRSGARKKWDQMLAGRNKAIDQSWVNAETARVVQDFDSADRRAKDYDQKKGAPENLSPQAVESRLILRLYRMKNPTNKFAPPESFIRQQLQDAREAVRNKKNPNVQDYLKKQLDSWI